MARRRSASPLACRPPGAKPRLALLVCGAIFGVFAVLVFQREFRWLEHEQAFLKDAVIVPGRVAEIQQVGKSIRKNGAGGQPLFAPVFTFEDGRKQLWRVLDTEYGETKSSYQPGQSVEVTYSPANPGRARIQRPSRWVFLAGVALYGVVCLGLSLLLIRTYYRERRALRQAAPAKAAAR